MMIAAQKGALYAGNPHTQLDEVEIVSKKPGRESAKTKRFDFLFGRTVYRWLLGLQFLSLFVAGQVCAKDFTESEPNGRIYADYGTPVEIGYRNWSDILKDALTVFQDNVKVKSYNYNDFGTIGGANTISGMIEIRDPVDDDIFRFSPRETGDATISISGDVSATLYDCMRWGSGEVDIEWVLQSQQKEQAILRVLGEGNPCRFHALQGCTYYVVVSQHRTLANQTGARYRIDISLPGRSDYGGSTVILQGDETFYVTFNGNGGTVKNLKGQNCGQSMRLEEKVGATYGTLPTATCQGRIFNGWFTSSSGGSQVTASTQVSKSVTDLYAHWSQQSHTVYYKKGSYGVGTDTQDSKVYGTPLTLRGALFTRTGYSQVGWKSSGGVNYALKDVYSQEQDITFYPRWESALPTSYVIKFNPNGGAGTMANQTCQYGTDTRLRANAFTRTGYEFLGWSLSQTATSPTYADQRSVSFTRSSQVEYVLYAIWKAVNVPDTPGSVSFGANGGSGTMANQSYVIGKPLTLRACAFWRTGYDFSGWSLSASGTVKYLDGETFVPDQGTSLKLYAVWTPKPIVVTFDENLPDFISMRTVVYTYGQNFGKLPEPSKRRGYAFLGWYTDRIAGTALTSATTVPTADTAYYAHWEAVDEKVKVLLNVNGGNFVTPSEVEYVVGVSRATTFGSLPLPTHGQGNEFAGWYDALVGGNRISPDTLVTGDVTQLYAHWRTSAGMGEDGYFFLDEGESAAGRVSSPLLVQGVFPAYSARQASHWGKTAILSFSVGESGNYDIYLPPANVQDRVVDLEGTKYSDLVTAKNAVHLEICTASGEVIAQCDVGKTSVYLTQGVSYLLKVIHVGWRNGGLPTVYWEHVNYTAQIGGSVPIVPYLDAPTGVSASTNLVEGVRITWNPVAGAKRYVVYKWHVPPQGKTGDSAYPYELGGTEGTEYLDMPADVPTREARTPLKTLLPELLDDPKPFGGTYHVVAVGDGARSQASETVEGRVVEDLILSTTSAEVSAVGGELRVFVLSSVNWDFSCSADWVDIQVEKRSWCESELRMSVAPNESATSRRCVCYVGGQSVQIVQKESGDDVQISFETDGGVPLEDQAYKSGASFSDLPVPEKTGYSFVNWKAGSAAGERTVTRADLVGNSDQRLFADWQPNTYRVRFDGNGATGGSSPDQFFEYDVPQKLAPNGYVRQGCVLVGWALKPDGEVYYANEEEVVNLIAEEQGVIVLYAKWRLEGTPVLIPGDKVTIDTALVGWTPSGLPTGLAYNRTTGMITGAATKPGEYAVKFTKSGAETEEMTIVVTAVPKIAVEMVGVNAQSDTNGCKVTGAKEYLVGAKATLAATVPTGTMFEGWFRDDQPWPDEATHLNKSVTFTMGKEDVALVAKFKKEKISVACTWLSEGTFTAGVAAGAEDGILLDDYVSTKSGIKSIAVTKLPSGMTYNATKRIITGFPNKAGAYNVEIVVTAKSGAVEKQTIPLIVEALPAWAVGNFEGTVRCADGTHGTASFAVSAAGAISSGKLLEHGSNWTFTAKSYATTSITRGLEQDYVILADAKCGTVTRQVELHVMGCAVEGVAENAAAAAGFFGDAELEFWRNVWKDADAKGILAGIAGKYTYFLADGAPLSLDLTSVGALSGKANVRARDNASVSFSSTVFASTNGVEAAFYVAPDAKKGYAEICERFVLDPRSGAREEGVAHRAPGVIALPESYPGDTGTGSVSVTPKGGQVDAGKTVTASATPDAKSVFVKWRYTRDGGVTWLFSEMSKLALEMDGEHDVEAYAVFRSKGSFAAPEVTVEASERAKFAALELGVRFSASVTVTDEENMKPVKWSAQNLPTGLKINAETGEISGVATAVNAKPVVITATSVADSQKKTTFTLDVGGADGKPAALPETAVGTFTGFVTNATDNVATFTFTSSDKGTLSAKVVDASGTVSFSGSGFTWSKGGKYGVGLETKKGEKLTLTLDSAAGWDTDQLTGAYKAANGLTRNVTSQRNAFLKAWYFAAVGDEKTGWTFAFTTDVKVAALTVTMKADGTTSIAGKLPNGVDKNGRDVTLSVSASGVANVGMMTSGALAADFAPVLTVGGKKKVLSVRMNLWFDCRNDHPEGIGAARFVE